MTTEQTQLHVTFRDALEIANWPAHYSDTALQAARKRVTEYMSEGLCQAAARAAMTRLMMELVNRYQEQQAC